MRGDVFHTLPVDVDFPVILQAVQIFGAGQGADIISCGGQGVDIHGGAPIFGLGCILYFVYSFLKKRVKRADDRKLKNFWVIFRRFLAIL
jgi:hypothetical protein